MIRKYYFLILVFLICNCSAFNSVDSIFNNANQLYTSGDFPNALIVYESLLDQKIYNKTLYYNIGNCYYKLTMLGYARLYYEKAKLYDSSDSDVSHNLTIVQNRLIDDSLYSDSKYNVYAFSLCLNYLYDPMYQIIK